MRQMKGIRRGGRLDFYFSHFPGADVGALGRRTNPENGVFSSLVFCLGCSKSAPVLGVGQCGFLGDGRGTTFRVG